MVAIACLVILSEIHIKSAQNPKRNLEVSRIMQKLKYRIKLRF